MRRRWTRLRSLSATQIWIIAASLVLLPTVNLSVRLRGFVETAAVLAARSARPVRPATAESARPIAEAVAVVAGRPLVGARCLGRSLVLWFLLRRRGVDAELVIGAAASQPGAPLPAHAWVEVDGAPVNDTTDVRARYPSFDVPLPRLPRANASVSKT